MEDRMCGIFGVYGLPKAAELTVIGLHGIQHRAIDYAGIVSSDGSHLYRECGAGLARQVFTEERIDRLHGMHALGHIRYPTVFDDKKRDNIQPILGRYNGMPIAIAHNGNLTNIEELRQLLPSSLKLSTSMDTEYILRLLEHFATGNLEEDLIKVFSYLRGSFTLGILLPGKLIVAQDRSSCRPLSIGKLGIGGYFVSSETCAFPHVDAKYVCDVKPGTMMIIGLHGIRTRWFAEPKEKKCRFEGIYYALPVSAVFGKSVMHFRLELGRRLEAHCPVVGGADIVTPVPDSANFIAIGYGENGRSGNHLPVILRSHYVGRTFIAATQLQRDEEILPKFQYAAEEISGKRIVIVDDSIVRGTTMPEIVSKLRFLGAKEVHVRIGCPPITHPCKYGINTPTYNELIATRFSSEEMCAEMGADSLKFLPLQVLKELSAEPDSFCYACWTGEYWDRKD